MKLENSASWKAANLRLWAARPKNRGSILCTFRRFISSPNGLWDFTSSLDNPDISPVSINLPRTGKFGPQTHKLRRAVSSTTVLTKLHTGWQRRNCGSFPENASGFSLLQRVQGSRKTQVLSLFSKVSKPALRHIQIPTRWKSSDPSPWGIAAVASSWPSLFQTEEVR